MAEAWREGGGEAPAATERTGRLLGYLGLIPVVILAIWLFAIAPDHPWRAGTTLLLKTYAAVVLSFLGGVRWGLAVGATRGPTSRELAIGILPVLLAWAALALPAPYAFGLLAVAFAAQGAWDSFAAHTGRMPAWLGKLRIRLTVVVAAALILALAATV